MVFILNQAPRSESTSERFAKAFGEAGGVAGQGIAQHFLQKQQDEVKRLQEEEENNSLEKMGINLRGISDPTLRSQLVSQQLKQSSNVDDTKKNAIGSIKDMKEIVSRGNTGWNFFNKLTPKGRADRAALDVSALNLEKLAADMVGKGTLSKERFNFLKDRLPSSGKSDAENEAILDEWEKILTGHQPDEEEEEVASGKKVPFSKENKEHIAKAKQLFKKFNDKEKVRKELAKEFTFE